MAWDIQGFDMSQTAGGTLGQAGSDLSVATTVNSISCPNGYQYMAVKMSGGLVVPVTAATDAAIGVLQNKPAPGTAAQVRISGVTRMRSSDATITVGTTVYLDAFGMATHTKTGSSGSIGVAEEVSATAAGYMIAVLLKPLGAVV
jgi:hypothetical protein